MSSRPYRNIDEMISMSLGLISSFNNKDIDKIRKWFVLTKTNEDHKTKFAFQTLLYECLWNIPEAIELGFYKYYIRELTAYKDLLNYHEINCEGENCIICKDRKEILKRLGATNERKESRIYAK